MPRSSRPSAYGTEYEHFLTRVAAEGTCTIPLQSPGHAATMRGKLYAYFKALRRAGTRPDLIAIVDRISLQVVGSSLRAFPVEDSWDNVALREGLGIAKGAVPTMPSPETSAFPLPATAEPTAQDKLKQKLWEIRQRNAQGKEKQ